MLEEQHENLVAAVTKWEMLAATNQMQGENERQWKKVNKNISSKEVTGSFTLQSCGPSRAKQRQRNVQ